MSRGTGPSLIPHRRSRLRNKILLYLFLLSLPPLLMGGLFAYFRALDFANGFYERELLTATKEIAARINWRKDENMTFAEYLALDLAGTPRTQWRSSLSNIIKAEPQLYAAHVMDLTGQNISRGDSAPLRNYADRIYFKEGAAGRGFNELLLSRAYNDRPAICTSSPVYEKPGAVTAVVAVCRFIDQHLTQIEETVLGKTAHLFIADSNNEILVYPRLEVRTSQLTEVERIPLSHSGKDPNHRLEFKSGGKNYISFKFPLSDSWQLIAIQEKGELTMDANNLISIPVIVCLILLFLALLASVIAIDHGILPLLKMAEAAKRLGSGNFQVKIPVQSEDEIGTLARSFNEMTQKLKEQFESLQEKELLLSKSKEDLEEQVLRQSQKLIYSTKMSSLGEMAGSIAHEINNPLTIISLKAHGLKASIQSPYFEKDLALEKLEKIEKTCLRITQIVRGLRAFSRDGSQDPMVLENLSSIIHDTIALCSETIRSRGISLEAVCPEDIEVECQPVQLGQVLLNLLSNAKDAVHNLSGEKFIRIIAEKNEDHAVIVISDNGAGVSLELHDKIMQPFFTTKRVGEGTGLGLSISKGILEQHHGSLSLESTPGETRFIIRLPLKQP